MSYNVNLMSPYLALRLFYFFYFGTLGVMVPYLPVLLKQHHLKASQIGLVMAAWPLAKLVAPIFWSRLADRLNKRNLFMQLGSLLCFISFLLFFGMQRFHGFLAVMFLFSFFRMVLLPLIDTAALEYCETHRKEYGQIRYWGSLGFVTASFLFGWLIDHFSIVVILWGISAILLLQMGAVFHLPRSVVAVQKREEIRFDLGFCWQKAIVGFMIASLLRSVSFGTYDIFFSIWMGKAGYSASMIGFCWALAVMAEVVAMFYFARLSARFSLKALMTLGLFSMSLRWLILATTSWLPAILFEQILHAFSFGVYQLAAVAYMYQHTPSHLRATGQAVYQTVSFGMGSILGFWGLSLLKEYLSYEMLFLICSGIAALGLCFIPWFKEKPRGRIPEEPVGEEP